MKFNLHASRSSLLPAVAFLLPMQNAVACISEEGSSASLPYVVAFIVALMLTIILAAATWGIKRLFFRRINPFTMLALVSIILGMILGAFATFVVPEFEFVYQFFGADIPMPTGFIFRFRFLLWLPLLLIAISFLRLHLQVVHLRYYLLGAMSETMLLLLVLMVLYAPIFKFGCLTYS
ncbi:MAG: hypothetical protein LBB76_00655 [Azoarcus sp.]|nr:hypothetical protein [Azoarcus sp.]